MQYHDIRHAMAARATGIVAASVFITAPALAAEKGDWATRSDLNIRPGITQISHDVLALNNLALYVMGAIGLFVLVLIFWAMIRHRRSVHPEPANFHENTFLEITWTVVPVIILIALAWPSSELLIRMYDTSGSDLTVKVTGSRWHWNYEYVAYEGNNAIGVSFYSNLTTPKNQLYNPVLPGGLFPYGTAKDLVGNGDVPKDHYYKMEVDKPLVLPSNTKIRFLITSDDVIHSFFVPDFGWKKDAIPGYINTDWTYVPAKNEGTYYGTCAELCGKGHAYMPIEVKIVSKKEFGTWLTKQEKIAAQAPDITPFANIDEAMKVGKKTFHAVCAMCHGDKGQGGIGPKMAGNPFFTDKANIHKHIHIVTHGLNAMPDFSAQLSPREIAGVITFERNAFGNNSGQLIQPKQVLKIEKEK